MPAADVRGDAEAGVRGDPEAGVRGDADALSRDADLAAQAARQRGEHLVLDPRPPAELDAAVLEPMDRTGRTFWVVTAVLGGLVATWAGVWLVQIARGLGITGLNRPVMWALYIVNFVYFVGIGHAGTFISAALRVLNVEWRRPISRAAETLTVFALITAALFPLVHLGRAWKFYWMVPYPNARQLWPSFHSPLLWDLTAIFTYLTCSILFVYIGLLPDLAMARDRSHGRRARLYSVLAMGWRGREREWANQDAALRIFSYAIIPVMFSVHTIVSWDFAMALQPGWHSTVFGPYFVAGALYSGVAAVIIVLVLLRSTMRLDYFLRDEHFDGMGKFLLLLSLVWAYFYFNDYLAPWYGQEPVEKSLYSLLEAGWASPLWRLMLVANVIVPWATLWSRRVRTSLPALLGVSVLIQIGMYLERFLIVPVALGRNALPFDWGRYIPRAPESLITVGAFAFVALAYVLFTRVFPVIPVWEVLEGQARHGLHRVGRALVSTRDQPE